LQQADRLIAAPQPDQTDLRRAISAAYYAVFHFVLIAAADMVVGAAGRSTPLYSLAYRSVDHSRLKTLCSQLKGSQVQAEIASYLPAGGFGEIADFARLAGNLIELRNLADYDPSRNFTLDAAQTAVSEARQAIKHFQTAKAEQQSVFLTLLLFKPR
jgi:hypothetical protein